MDCLFCNICSGAIPAQKVHEDELALVFADIEPKAPVHLLLIPKKHITSLAHAEAEDQQVLGHLLALTTRVASEQGLKKGYRTVINTGEDGGQTVGHLHVHLLGGRPMHWPPG